jgi:hypothetical protein
MNPQYTYVTGYTANGTPGTQLEFTKGGTLGTLNAVAYDWVFSTLIPNYTPNIGEPP